MHAISGIYLATISSVLNFDIFIRFNEIIYIILDDDRVNLEEIYFVNVRNSMGVYCS